jgi:hypothetical protein
MGAKLTPAEHEGKKWAAFDYSLSGHHAPAIARALGLSETTTKKLIRAARRESRASRLNEANYELERYLASQDAVTVEGWRRLEALDANASGVVGLLALLGLTYERKARALGLLTHRPEQNEPSRTKLEYLEDLDKLLDSPVPVALVSRELPSHPAG